MLILCLAVLLFTAPSYAQESWQLGPFERIDEIAPILSPEPSSTFFCPIQNKLVSWEKEHLFNPAAIVRQGKVFLLYRAEDDFGTGIGRHTSRLGLAESSDGIHFQRYPIPVLFPDHDDQKNNEWPGGCEDPRIVEREDGSYVMTYTQWNRLIARLAIATSPDLIHWKKHGYAFAQANKGAFGPRWSKSGSIVCKRHGDRLIAAKIRGNYWMYWGEGTIFCATSKDLIHWEPLLDQAGNLLPILQPRPLKFDSALVEAGPPALLTEHGILLLYNGKNSPTTGDPAIANGAYSAGQLLLDANDPAKTLARSENCFFKPEMPYETRGQYKGGTVFIQGLVPFEGHWLLYYGAADSVLGAARAPAAQ